MLPLAVVGLVGEAMGGEKPPETAEQKALYAIARGIEALKAGHPQLEGFTAAKCLRPEALTLEFAHKTHEPEHRGGWTSGVPNPDPDGLWFHVDIHEADSTAQIHTQPRVEPLCFGKKRVQFLILEGAKTRPVAGKIRAVLLEQGVAPCPPAAR